MDNAKPNERSLPAAGAGWSSRLEEPGALPGVGLTDKEAAWDKLYDRLRETPRRRTLPWLWAAAACLLLALIPAAFFLREKRTIPHSPEPKVAVQPKPTRARTYPAPAQKPTTQPPGSQLAAQNSKLKTRCSQLRAHRSPVTAHRSPVVTPSSQLVARSLQLAAPPAPPAHRLPLAACGLPPRVVHINELEPAQPTPSTAGERLKPGRLQVRFTPSETFRPATTYNNDPIDHPIIPLKHPQNP
jgi:hypothetical protein